ncbi:hypothetical protein Mcup_1127 [Metallosphaera cuprina Ar-4]|uniref:Uncharacterized protein n=1 Tax=Metallosphaera cuprina (strain Ar-4) TaxID=1006006 RepID=F4G334_METCR|nr:hypothetical protein Mcup_1127 [Metallosphaera cuprina Ar-4]
MKDSTSEGEAWITSPELDFQLHEGFYVIKRVARAISIPLSTP